jgi:phosphonate transport system substrate-binding protein
MSAIIFNALRTVGLVVCAAVLSIAAAARAAEPLRIGMVPDAGATQVSVEEKAPLQSYLEKALDRPVKLIIPTSYNATVEGIGNGSLDVAYFGGLTYIKAHARYGATPLVQRDIDQHFHALVITRPETGIASLKGLIGKTFCFGDINSTSGHLYPYLAMMQAGVSPDKQLKSFRYTGSHAATAQAVAAGACDAGSLDETVYEAMTADGEIQAGRTRVVYTTQVFPDYVWASRHGLDARTQQAFSDALLRLQPGRDDQILKILRGEHFVRAYDGEYAEVERIAKALGLM